MSSRIYFITDNFRVKIGKANNPTSRLKTLQTGNHLKLSILHTEVGGLEREKELHKMFAKSRIGSSEWFEISEGLLNYINNNSIYYVECQDGKLTKYMKIKK